MSSAPGPNSTHGVFVDGDEVVKRYASAERREPQREWAALNALAQHAPGLAPRPLELSGPPWTLRMSRVGGAPRPRDKALAAEQLTRLGVAFERMWSIPIEQQAALPPRIMDAHATSELVTRQLGDAPAPDDSTCRAALAQFREWFLTTGKVQVAQPCPTPVFSRGDQNLDNVLWDAESVRLVDFEDAGLSCRTYDLADLTEHISSRGTPDARWQAFASTHRDSCQHLFVPARRLVAAWWLLALLPAGVGRHRNPKGSDVRQAERLLALLCRDPCLIRAGTALTRGSDVPWSL